MKLTDHEIIAMSQQYTTTRNEAEFICHIAYREINRQVREEGRQWSKCMDCGNPYPLDKENSSLYFCSTPCEVAYTKYLENLEA